MLMSSDDTGILSFTDRQAEALWGSQKISEGATHMLRGTFGTHVCGAEKHRVPGGATWATWLGGSSTCQDDYVHLL